MRRQVRSGRQNPDNKLRRKKLLAVAGALLGVFAIVFTLSAFRNIRTLVYLDSENFLGSAIMAGADETKNAPEEDFLSAPFVEIESYQSEAGEPYGRVEITYTTQNVISCSVGADRDDIQFWTGDAITLNVIQAKTPALSDGQSVRMGAKTATLYLSCIGRNGKIVSDEIEVRVEQPLRKPTLTISAAECSKSPLLVKTTVDQPSAIIPSSCANIGSHPSLWDIGRDQIVSISSEAPETIQVRCDTFPSSGFGYVLSNILVRNHTGSTTCLVRD